MSRIVTPIFFHYKPHHHHHHHHHHVFIKPFFSLTLTLPLNPFTLPSIIKSSSSSLSFLLPLHALSITSSLSPSDPFVHSSLLHSYLRHSPSSLPTAHHLFDQIPHPDIFAFSALISAYASNPLTPHIALSLFHRMRSSNIPPNNVTFNGLIAGFNRSGHPRKAILMLQTMHSLGFALDAVSVSSALPSVGQVEDYVFGGQVHGVVCKAGFVFDFCVATAVIDMYGKCRRVEEMVRAFEDCSGRVVEVGCCNALVTGLARNVQVEDALDWFGRFRDKGLRLNVISWTSIVACCSQNGKDVEALDLFREMQVAGVKPNLVTIPCLLPACANIAALMMGRSAHGFVVRRSFCYDVYVASALVDMYAKCGRIKQARILFDTMPMKNVVSWNSMVGGYAMHGNAKEAIEVFELMIERRQKPDSVTFTCILSACSQAGLTEEGKRYFNRMCKDFGIVAGLEHYACMVSLLGRSGKLEEAYELIQSMPSNPDACIWGALLSSCRVHGNVSLGEIAAEKLFVLEPGNAGNYVLISNIYSSKGMWKEVDRVRDTMKGMGMKKDPGCSCIEVKNKVHTLLAGDTAHPQMKQIIEKLEKIGTEMRRLGYRPSTGFVLQDVEEQEKEHILCGHSEKLALAFGLLSTSAGTPLRIIKNLRICGDCHDAMKFVSKFEGREISVRDTNRFHHFRDGVCSCGDYW